MKNLFKKIGLLALIVVLSTTMLFVVSCDSDDTTTTTTAAPDNGNETPNENPDQNENGGNQTPDNNNTQNPTETPTNPTYTIKIVDQDGNPVQGAIVQFCVGTLCDPQLRYPSNAEGIITITHKAENADYQISVLSAPNLTIDATDVNDVNAQKHTFDENHSMIITLTYPEAAE